jgi:hypothetical protein
MQEERFEEKSSAPTGGVYINTGGPLIAPLS